MNNRTLASLLPEIGVFGYNEHSKAIMATLISGDPILLVGDHGTGKTLLAERLAELLGFTVSGDAKQFQAYDASKSLFEDVVGFPDPNKMISGVVDYLNSPITIWNKEFILVDELSRANPAMQNKWLEIIRSRRVMGRAIPRLQYIFSAMNPLSYIGANPLDVALADRFALVVHINNTFSKADINSILTTDQREDSPLLSKKQSGINQELSSFLHSAIDGLRTIHLTLNPQYSNYATAFASAFYEKVNELGVNFSPRRAAMLKRSIELFITIDLFEGRPPLSEENFLKPALYSWIQPVVDEEAKTDVLTEAALYALGKAKVKTSFKKKKDQTTQVFEMYNSLNEEEDATPTNENDDKDEDTGFLNLSQSADNINLEMDIFGNRKPKKSKAKNSDDDDDEDDEFADSLGIGDIVGEGISLLTKGFYDMVIKGNNKYKSPIDQKREQYIKEKRGL